MTEECRSDDKTSAEHQSGMGIRICWICMRQLDMYLLHMTEGVDTHMLHMTEVFKLGAVLTARSIHRKKPIT